MTKRFTALFVIWLSLAALSRGADLDPITPEDKAFFSKIQKAVTDRDVEWLSKAILYPITVTAGNKKLELKRQEDFKRRATSILSAPIQSAVKNQKANLLFKNWQGIMIGNGEIWFEQIGNKTPKGMQWTYRIIAINDTRNLRKSLLNDNSAIRILKNTKYYAAIEQRHPLHLLCFVEDIEPDARDLYVGLEGPDIAFRIAACRVTSDGRAWVNSDSTLLEHRWVEVR